MKKMINVIKKSLKSFVKTIDKKIITPITKVVLRFSSKKDNSGKFFENWLSKRNTLLFISLFLAVLVFINI